MNPLLLQSIVTPIQTISSAVTEVDVPPIQTTSSAVAEVDIPADVPGIETNSVSPGTDDSTELETNSQIGSELSVSDSDSDNNLWRPALHC